VKPGSEHPAPIAEVAFFPERPLILGGGEVYPPGPTGPDGVSACLGAEWGLFQLQPRLRKGRHPTATSVAPAPVPDLAIIPMRVEVQARIAM